eukprot:scaffold1685_cov390-Prasinococcus_capsulatus_cf.AAC.3
MSLHRPEFIGSMRKLQQVTLTLNNGSLEGKISSTQQHTWHLLPYLQCPVSSQDRHSSVLYRLLACEDSCVCTWAWANGGVLPLPLAMCPLPSEGPDTGRHIVALSGPGGMLAFP